jgi:hypothetical protein
MRKIIIGKLKINTIDFSILKKIKLLEFFDDYLELRGLDSEEGTLCYVEKYKDSYPEHYSTIHYIVYYTAIYKLIDEKFILCKSLEGDLSKELECNGIKSYIQLFKEVEEKNKSNMLDKLLDSIRNV